MSHPPAFDDQPLGLTVHSMPTPQDLAAPQQTRMGRWKMLLVLLVCAAPVVASYFTYYVLRPEGRRNFGELINPQKPLPDLVATALDGRQVNLQTLKDQWLLISVAGAACDAACADGGGGTGTTTPEAPAGGGELEYWVTPWRSTHL